MTPEELGTALCELLAGVLLEKPIPPTACSAELLALAERHKVLPLLCEVCPDEAVVRAARRTAMQSYHLLFLSRYLQESLTEYEIPALFLKGAVTAEAYPVPELRKSGDIDVLFPSQHDVVRARLLLEASDFSCVQEHSLHHVVCQSPDGICVELHSMLAEPFDSKRVGDVLLRQQKEFFTHMEKTSAMGVTLNAPAAPYHTYYLLLHMLQHFLRAGFGLKLLCDWTVVLSHDMSRAEQETLVRLLNESGTAGFAAAVTAVCVSYLGLSVECCAFLHADAVSRADIDALFAEIVRAGEFGRSDRSRMLIVQGTGISSYFREFRHQTRLTYPRASRCVLLLPILWLFMLAGFLYRNHSVRGVSAADIFRQTEKRSRLAERMQLFKLPEMPDIK